MSAWSVELCQGWQRIGQLSMSASWVFRGVRRWLQAGEWTLSFPEGEADFSQFTDGEGNLVRFRPSDVDTIRLVEDGKVRYWGYVFQASDGQGGAERIRDASGDRWTLSGPDLWHVLRSRLAFPDPTVQPPASWTVSHDERSGQASTVLAGYLEDNIGASGLIQREASFNAVDGQAGIIGSWSARLQTLGELTQRIADEGGITVSLTELNGTISATVGAQPSAGVLVSDKADVTRLVTRDVPRRSTWVLAGGQGEGAGRVFRHANGQATGFDRFEIFTDQASLTTGAELQQAANARLAADADTWSVIVEVSDQAAQSLGFGRTIDVGANVTIEVDEQRHIVPVQSIAYDISAERQQINPTLGTAAPDLLQGLRRDVAGLEERFGRNIR